jgi:hypothetical protein
VFGRGLDSFVREVLQNSHDQKRNDVAGVTVFLRLHELEGTHCADFLTALGWSKLQRHLAAVASGMTNVASVIRPALDEVAAGRIRLLTIGDSGAHGLTGGEDDEDSNYNNLCRNILQTSNDRGDRGGSHGLGKAVLWNFSRLKTVLFSSTLDTPTGTGLRLFGRTDLPSHETGADERWNGPGWYGLPDSSGTDRAVSAWDRTDGVTDIARRLQLDRSGLSTGTSVLVVGFFEPGLDEQRDGHEVIEELLRYASRWFWPSLLREPPTLQVAGQVLKNDRCVFSEVVTVGDDVRPYRDAMTATTLVSKAVEPGEVAEREITFQVPALKSLGDDAGHPPIEGQVNLRLIRSTGSASAKTNDVALIRGAGMVVQYWRPSRTPLDGGGFHGVLRVGQAHGASDTDLALERFFRAAEPPEHDKWVSTTDQMSRYHTGARARLNELWEAMNATVIDLCDQDPPSTKEGPALLAKLFPLESGGTGGGGSKTSFRVRYTSHNLSDGIWTVTGNVQRKSTEEARAWGCTLALWLEGETGKGERLPLASLTASPAGYVAPDGHGRIDIPHDVDAVSFEMTAHGPASGFGRALLARTRIRAEVHPRFDGSAGIA